MSDDRYLSSADGYNRWAAFYDRYPNPTVAIDELSFPALWRDLQGKDILEIGCGTGRHTQKLAAANRVTGIDTSREMIAAARQKPGCADVRFIEADFMLYDGFAPAQFDAVITSLVVEHIADLGGFYSRAAAILRPGGMFFLSEIHPDRTAGGIFAHFRDESGEEFHLKSYPHTPAQMEEAARAARFLPILKRDGAGTDDLAALNPRWAKYHGLPMIQMWQWQKGG